MLDLDFPVYVINKHTGTTYETICISYDESNARRIFESLAIASGSKMEIDTTGYEPGDGTEIWRDYFIDKLGAKYFITMEIMNDLYNTEMI